MFLNYVSTFLVNILKINLNITIGSAYNVRTIFLQYDKFIMDIIEGHFIDDNLKFHYMFNLELFICKLCNVKTIVLSRKDFSHFVKRKIYLRAAPGLKRAPGNQG